ncbi:Spo7-like protein-domain-containing protein [Geopyxis carbonaria]|nr:Spo7-like protein-domain-containing protein [Geopyxis carbonaria]
MTSIGKGSDLRGRGSLSIPKQYLTPHIPLEPPPSSASQTYFNLLLVEASLRSQYLNHLARRRKFTFFLLVLFLWILFFYHRFYVLGGSPYYYISHFEKLGFGGGVVTGVLYYATGLYHKTIVEPRQFVSIANRGLRGFNVKLVKVPLTSREWLSWWWGWYFLKPPPIHHTTRRRPSSNTKRPPHSTWGNSGSPTLSSGVFRQTSSSLPDEDEEDEEIEEYLPGGLHIKLVILPKRFSPDFREGWELYRTEYWEKQNEARQSRLLQLKTGHRIKPEEPQEPQRRVRRSSRAGSISSHRGRTPTPEPDTLPIVRTRKGSTASLKRRSIVGMSRAGTPGDISDSGSTTSVVGDWDRSRRSDSVRTDKSSSSTSSLMENKRKSNGGGRGKKRIGRNSAAPMGDANQAL